MDRERVERIAELVRDARSEQQHRRGALILDPTLGGLLLFGHITQDHGKPPGGTAAATAKRHHIEPHSAWLRIGQLKLPRHDRQRAAHGPIFRCGVNRWPQARHEAPQRLACELIVTNPDETMRGRVGILDHAIG